MAREFHYDWHVDLKSSAEALWPFAADTNRFNHDTGLPPVIQDLNAPDVTAGSRRLSFSLFGQKVVWDEEPFQWIFPHHFEVIRRYRQGPIAEMRVIVDLTDRPEGGTHLRYQAWARPANLLGYPGIFVVIGLFSARQFISIYKKYDEIIQHGGSHYDIQGRVRFASGGRERLGTARKIIIQNETQAAAFDRLAYLLEHADDLALQRLRPYQLAGYWKLPRRDVLEVFLRAARVGILDMRWDLLCPSCRGAGVSHASLGEVHKSAHCGFCNIDYTVNFDRQVEVIFRPNPSVRIVPNQLLYCVAGPQTEPHLAINTTLSAGETLEVAPSLLKGHYSLSASGISGELPVMAELGGLPKVVLAADPQGWPEGELVVEPSPSLQLLNQTAFPQTFTLERTAWRDDAATAADVTSLQLFRDLFSREALRSGEEIEIGSVTLMFTDLRDSTRLYRQIGDAPAFGRVRQHFDLLEQAIATEGGSIVKTMGDAVMAVFRQPVAAMRAVKSAHAAISTLEGNPALAMKVGIHTGPCIVVTLNERLDYFGSTVNIAARLPGMAEGGEVVFSNEIKLDPEVITWLKENYPEPLWFEARVKGYDQPFSMWRMWL